MTNLNEFQSLAQELQRDLAFSETIFSGSPDSGSRGPALMILRLRNLKLKMYQERGHTLPHLHVDYGNRHHAASFSIEPPRCIEGHLEREAEATVESWIAKNRKGLLALWCTLQAGDGDAHNVIAGLVGNEA